MEQTGTVTGQQKQAGVDQSLEAMVRKFNDTFNRFDSKAIASFWSDDGTLLTPAGSYGKGRSDVEKVYLQDRDTILKGTTSKFTIGSVRKITDDCVLLDLDHELQNCKKPDGTTGTMKMHVAMLCKKKGAEWEVLDARPYALMERPRQLH